MYTVDIRAETRLPNFFACEHQHGRGVTNERMEQYVQHRAIGHALGTSGRIAIEAVLADIEEEGRQIFVRKIGQQADIIVKVKIIDRLPQLHVHVGEQMEHITLQLRHVGNC